MNDKICDVNQLTICRDDYSAKEEFEDAIKIAIMLLLNNNYIMTVRYENKNVVIIDYNYDDEKYGCSMPYWLTPDEVESIPE